VAAAKYDPFEFISPLRRIAQRGWIGRGADADQRNPGNGRAAFFEMARGCGIVVARSGEQDPDAGKRL
jgi:hypothetical protein